MNCKGCGAPLVNSQCYYCGYGLENNLQKKKIKKGYIDYYDYMNESSPTLPQLLVGLSPAFFGLFYCIYQLVQCLKK